MEVKGRAERLLNQLIENHNFAPMRNWLGDTEKFGLQEQARLAVAIIETIHGKFGKLEKLVAASDKKETD